MIPEDQARFLTGTVIAFVGTRNGQLRPSMAWAAAPRANAAEETITFILPDLESARVKEDLVDNGLIALTALDPLSHETYQYKGKYLGSRAPDQNDKALHDIHRAKINTRLREGCYRADLFDRFVFWPGTAVTFRVADIFIQTPGPQAGKRLPFVPSVK